MGSSKRPLYPGEFTWWLNDEQPAKRKKQIADMKRIKTFNHRQRVKLDNEAIIANVEKEMLAAAGER